MVIDEAPKFQTMATIMQMVAPSLGICTFLSFFAFVFCISKLLLEKTDGGAIASNLYIYLFLCFFSRFSVSFLLSSLLCRIFCISEQLLFYKLDGVAIFPNLHIYFFFGSLARLLRFLLLLFLVSRILCISEQLFFCKKQMVSTPKGVGVR